MRRNKPALQIAAAAIAGASVSACVMLVEDEGVDVEMGWDIDDPRPGALYAAQVANDEIIVRVRSYGCTDKADFDVDVDREGRIYEVEFDRDRRDRCDDFAPEGAELRYSFSELGIPSGAAVKIRNPVRAPE
ncbi:MAG: hypothetical protein Tsb0010_04590 [Parvularculaceae bacterium]